MLFLLKAKFRNDTDITFFHNETCELCTQEARTSCAPSFQEEVCVHSDVCSEHARECVGRDWQLKVTCL